jgi:hypothetical protein
MRLDARFGRWGSTSPPTPFGSQPAPVAFEDSL